MSSWVETPGFQNFNGHSWEDLQMDEAYLRIVSSSEEPLSLYSLSDDCYKCPYTSLAPVAANSTQLLTVDTKFPSHFLLSPLLQPFKKGIPLKSDDPIVCHVKTLGSASTMGEFGIYELTLNGTNPGTASCYLKTLVEPVNIYLSLLLIVLIFAVGIVMWHLFENAPRLLGDRFPILEKLSIGAKGRDSEGQKEDQSVVKKRLKSLDTFRGISIIVMIFVNYGGGGYWFTDHATWNGLQIADLVFPWFMWIMGVCIPMSVRSVIKRRVSLNAALLNVLRRSVILFGLGVMLNTAGRGADLGVIRIFGVLQRFGVAYLIVGSCAFLLAPKNEYQPPKKENEEEQANCNKSRSFWDHMVDVTSLKYQWLCMLTLVLVDLLILFLLPVPGCLRGYLGPGGIQNDEKLKGCTGGAAGYIDRVILGTNHIYQKPTSDYVYQSGPFDPEGILGCLTSIFQVFLGVQAGAILLYHRTHKARLTRWMVWSVVTGVIGAILCLCSKENGWIPVNKNLWSMSFVMVTSCFAFFLLSFCYILVDIKGLWSGCPFFYPGMNATIMYVGHSLAYDLFPWHWKFPGIPMNNHFINTIEALWGTALWVLIGYMLYRKKFFLSI